ncbi:UNVERIFIED_ORG: hypothetical protein J2W87_001551 [Pseudomonas putida]|nr:hypothetical protein [Pseudomonas putida]
MTSKNKEAGTPVDDAPAPQPETLCVFRDTLYTSRVLILLDAGRTLKVEKGQVAVASDDTVALDYLRGRKDFVAVEG